jgi:hypothetical protein
VPGVALSENVVTYETLILTGKLPTSIVTIGAGAGAIGMEFAFVLANHSRGPSFCCSGSAVLPSTRWPPPLGIRPTFLTST